ncbi:MAG TPA: hypothetical protein PKN48_02550 [Bacteroidales bacterium]|nr:hypothetical protein [Bacteroidales bacterium]
MTKHEQILQSEIFLIPEDYWVILEDPKDLKFLVKDEYVKIIASHLFDYVPYFLDKKINLNKH